jgi:hypothetical protein
LIWFLERTFDGDRVEWNFGCFPSCRTEVLECLQDVKRNEIGETKPEWKAATKVSLVLRNLNGSN